MDKLTIFYKEDIADWSKLRAKQTGKSAFNNHLISPITEDFTHDMILQWNSTSVQRLKKMFHKKMITISAMDNKYKGLTLNNWMQRSASPIVGLQVIGEVIASLGDLEEGIIV